MGIPKRFTADDRKTLTPGTEVEYLDGGQWHPGVVMRAVAVWADGQEYLPVERTSERTTTRLGGTAMALPGTVRRAAADRDRTEPRHDTAGAASGALAAPPTDHQGAIMDLTTATTTVPVGHLLPGMQVMVGLPPEATWTNLPVLIGEGRAVLTTEQHTDPAGHGLDATAAHRRVVFTVESATDDLQAVIVVASVLMPGHLTAMPCSWLADPDHTAEVLLGGLS